MAFRYNIPEISAITLLSSVEEKDGKFDIVYDAAEPSREYLVKWTQQDNCPMFHQAMRLLKGDDRFGYADGEALWEVFVYIDFSGIFDRKPVGKVAELQRKAEWMFRPEGIRLCLRVQTHRYIAFERSASMSRNSKLCFVREDLYEPLRERMMLGMTIGKCQLSKLYAYNGLLFTGGRRINSNGLLNDKRIIVIDNPKSVIPNVKTITVEDDGSDAPIREYHRVEKQMDIEITEFDGEGLVSPGLARHLDPMSDKGHFHHSSRSACPISRASFMRWISDRCSMTWGFT